MKMPANLLLAAALLAGASFAGANGADALPKARVNVVGTWANLSIYKDREHPFWTETIPSRSNGAIEVEIRAFTEMGLKGSEVFRLMSQGVIEFGSTVLGYVAGDDPENEAVDLAGLSADIDTAHEVTNAWKPVLADLYERKHGIRLLAVFPYHAQVLYCNGPLSGLADLKGKKIRTFSKSLSEFVETLGGTGVNIPFGEVVPALQKGVADCAITGALSGNLAKWPEVTDHLYALPVGWSMVMHGVNLEAWNALPAPVQDFLAAEIRAWEDRVWAAADDETRAGIACNTGGECPSGNPASMILVPVNEDDEALRQRIMETVIVPNWAERCGETCVSHWNDTVAGVVGITVSD